MPSVIGYDHGRLATAFLFCFNRVTAKPIISYATPRNAGIDSRQWFNIAGAVSGFRNVVFEINMIGNIDSLSELDKYDTHRHLSHLVWRCPDFLSQEYSAAIQAS